MFMSKRLAEIIQTYLVKTGNGGKADLCKAVGKSEQTLTRWIKQGVPSNHDAYKLALACGCSEKEALLLAQETSEARDTA